MLLILLIGWTILLPVVVVGGLYLACNVLGRRRRVAVTPLMPDPVRELALRVAAQTEAASAAQGISATPTVARATEPVTRRDESPARASEPVGGSAAGATS